MAEGAHLVCKEENVIQKSHRESIIQKFSSKNLNQNLLDLCLCYEFLRQNVHFASTQSKI